MKKVQWNVKTWGDSPGNQVQGHLDLTGILILDSKSLFLVSFSWLTN